MPLRALWAHNWAVWAMPVTLLVVATMNNRQLVFFDQYPLWLAAQKTEALTVLGMVTCLAGAAEGGWLRRSRLVVRPAARSTWARFAVPVVAAWLPTAAVLLAGVVAVGGGGGWQVWSTALLSLLAWTWVGFAGGIVFRGVIALPLSIVIAFGWFDFTPAVEPPWLRQLTGAWGGCCDTGSVPNASVSAEVVLVAIGLILGSSCVVWAWSRPIGRRFGWAALAPVVAGLVVAASLIGGVGHSPTQPRSDAVVCRSGAPELCFWPERDPYVDSDLASLRTILDHWAGLGVELPGRLSEDAAAAGGQAAPLVYSHSDTSERRAESLAQGLASGCPVGRDGLLGYHVVKDWLTIHSGVAGLDGMVSDPDALLPLLTEPEAEQVRQINQALAASLARG